MAKQGMKRPDKTPKQKNKDYSVVPEIQGKAKNGKKKTNPIIEENNTPQLKVFHTEPYSDDKAEKPISDAYPALDTDLAVDNLQNDIPEADLQDLN